ncbi:hypothetical protein A0256_22655 [Mucilaginibacter sp. PAMC 26640]|nr:hypothetical protein A0256_22655 [Mucilaginibacter sp. PAMC 26640]
MKFKNLITIFLGVMLFVNFSCTSYKNIPYLQDLNRDSITREKITNYTPLTIQNGDLLAIHVNSLSPEASSIFNYNLERPFGSGGNLSTAQENAVIGYYVKQDGAINLPLIGSVKASGYTTSEFSRVLEEKLVTVLTKPNVNVRIQNFKISILGDVKSPGTFVIQNEKVTLTEALSLAGDLNITGVRKITLIRETDGERLFVPIDLKSKSFFNSPYYYLKKNDVIYVTPNEQRAANDGSTFQRAGLLVSVLSIIAILLTR